MSRIVFWVALFILIGFALRAKLRSAARRAEERMAPPRASASPTVAIEDMTRCAHCGLHFPASEAVRADGLDYCSPGHVRLPPH
jgi:uncharacterized protein